MGKSAGGNGLSWRVPTAAPIESPRWGGAGRFIGSLVDHESSVRSTVCAPGLGRKRPLCFGRRSIGSRSSIACRCDLKLGIGGESPSLELLTRVRVGSAATINFVLPELSEFRDLVARKPSVDEEWQTFDRGPTIWTLQTFLLLRNQLNGMQVTCSSNYCRDAMNLAHAQDLARLGGVSPRIFVVSLQGDHRRTGWAHARIVQNRLQVKRPTDYWVSLWPQPGLIPRRNERKERVQRIGYFGAEHMLAGSRREWEEKLADLGFEFVCRQGRRWNDYSDIDLVICHRSFNHQIYPTKPASKLVNAWFAGVPAICGADSAFAQVGRPDQDYLVTTSMHETLSAIKKVARDPEIYRRLRDNGLRRSREFGRDRLVEAWESILISISANAYHAWRLAGARDSRVTFVTRKAMYFFEVLRGGTRRFVQSCVGNSVVNRLRMKFR